MPMSQEELNKRRDAFWERMLEIVSSKGWGLQYVFPNPDLSMPSFTYTVGLSAKGLPDLLVFGLPQQAHGIVNDIAQMLVDSKTGFEDGQVIREVASLPIMLRSLGLSDGFKFATGAKRFAEERDYTAGLMQIMLPDEAGRFPGEPGCDLRIELMQSIDLLVLKENIGAAADK